LKESIYLRKSVRTYDKKPLSANDRQAVEDLIEQLRPLKGPFGNSVRWFTFDVDVKQDEHTVKFGTYGGVKNARFFVGGIIKNTTEAMVDYGYLFEQLILSLTDMQLGTVWLGLMFQRKTFAEKLGPNEIIPAMTPVGYSADIRSIRDKITRFGIKADQRKPFEDMFFDLDLKHPIFEGTDHPHRFAPYLKLVQVAPSGTNKQPWRIIIRESNIDFYLERTPKYAKNMPYDIQHLDVGIALKHFEIGLLDDRIEFQIKKDSSLSTLEEMIYVTTINILT